MKRILAATAAIAVMLTGPMASAQDRRHDGGGPHHGRDGAAIGAVMTEGEVIGEIAAGSAAVTRAVSGIGGTAPISTIGDAMATVRRRAATAIIGTITAISFSPLSPPALSHR